jgi:glutathione S-transferase
MTNLYPTQDLMPSLSQSMNESNQLLKAQVENLFIKLNQLKRELKHYHKLKKRWNILKNILHYSTYFIAAALGVGDILLFFIPIIGPYLAGGGATLTVGEVLSINIFEDTLVHKKVEYYHKKCKHLTKWIERMYIFKTDALRDGLIDDKEIQQWRSILTEYEESIVDLKKPEASADLKKVKEQVNELLSKQRKL